MKGILKDIVKKRMEIDIDFNNLDLLNKKELSNICDILKIDYKNENKDQLIDKIKQKFI
jgi:hypothetical protein